MRRWPILLTLLVLPLFSSLVRPGYFPMQDNMQAFRLFQLTQCVLDGQLPCRWVPDMGYGYGYPLFIFYAPGPYYLGAAFHLLGLAYLDSVKLLFILGFGFSAWGMWLLLQRLFRSSLGSFVGTALYLYAPIRAVQVYVRGSLSEFLSLAIIPWVFLAGWNLVNRPRPRFAVSFAAAIAGLLLTHNLMSYLLLPVVIGWLVLLSWRSSRITRWLWLAIGLTLGVGLSAFFTLPLLYEKSWVHLESLIGGYFGYQQHFVNLYRLFIAQVWGYGSSAIGSGSDLALSAGLVHWLLSLLAIILSLIYFRRRPRLARWTLALSVVELGTLFLIHRRSSFIWEFFPFLAYLQFPWRLLVPSLFFTSLLAAAACTYLSAWSGLRWFTTCVITASILLFGGFYHPSSWFAYKDADLFTPGEWARQQTVSIFDYLPQVAVAPPRSPAPATLEVISGQAQVKTFTKTSRFLSGHILVTSSQALIRAPVFDYPGMEVFIDDQLISHSHSVCSGQPFCYGLISFSLPVGEHSYSIRFGQTPDRSWGDVISMTALLFSAGLVIAPFKHEAA